MIPIYVGFDTRERAAYHVFSQSVIENSSEPVSLKPLALHQLREKYVETHKDGSNAFIYSRFLVPFMEDYSGWAIFADGDMVCLGDIADLWRMRDETKAVMVAKHSYSTKHKRKYIGTSMETHNADYPRKNWSSMMVFNNALCRDLTADYVSSASGLELHRFAWTSDARIGALPLEWNWLVGEYDYNPAAKIVHYTLGGPYFDDYRDCDYAAEWFKERRLMELVAQTSDAVPAKARISPR